jgi:hypothetical protein
MWRPLLSGGPAQKEKEHIPYKKATLHFMTGTGNSFRTATWMAEAAQSQGTDAIIIPYERARVVACLTHQE